MYDMELFLLEALTQTHMDTGIITHRSRLFRTVTGPQGPLHISQLQHGRQ